MTPKTLTYARVFNLGNYENERIELSAELAPHEAIQTAGEELRLLVDALHERNQQARRHPTKSVREPEDDDDSDIPFR